MIAYYPCIGKTFLQYQKAGIHIIHVLLMIICFCMENSTTEFNGNLGISTTKNKQQRRKPPIWKTGLCTTVHSLLRSLPFVPNHVFWHFFNTPCWSVRRFSESSACGWDCQCERLTMSWTSWHIPSVFFSKWSHVNNVRITQYFTKNIVSPSMPVAI